MTIRQSLEFTGVCFVVLFIVAMCTPQQKPKAEVKYIYTPDLQLLGSANGK